MTRYLPDRPDVWHNVVPGLCQCHTSYAGRGMIDPTCDWHTAIDVIEDLRDAGWTVDPPTGTHSEGS